MTTTCAECGANVIELAWDGICADCHSIWTCDALNAG
jgi:Zn finger protein HypA/HybF involved in hydrogenase expression